MSPPPTPDDDAAGPTRLHATTVGEAGQGVLFLHGLFGQGRNFSQAAKALTPHLRSVLLDLPNHGGSAWTDTVEYVPAADAVAAHLREHERAPVHVVGHSMGGKVAMLLALRHPGVVERLVVVDIAPAHSGGSEEFAHLLDSLARVDLAAVGQRSDAREQLARWVPDERVRAFLLQNLVRDGDGWRWRANLDLLRAGLATIVGFPEVEGTFDHPVLWVAGADSPYIGPEHEAPMHALFPRTLSVTVKGAGHWVHSEQPEAFVSVLSTFLLADDADL